MTNSRFFPKARIILVRHGQSVANTGSATESHITNPLTELGWAQARNFADGFNCSPTRFVLSSFLRARQTAAPLLQRFPFVPIEDWPIQEFTYLEPTRHDGTTEDERLPHVLRYWERCDPAYQDGPNAESFSHFFDRTRNAIHRLSATHPGDCIVLFTHGLWMQAFRLCLLFPNTTDKELMANFRSFHFVNLIRNLDQLEFTALDGQILPAGQRQLSVTSFTLQGATSHE